ncbi:MAG: phosphatase PAP2 family protein [Candidatus Hodarchaeota archaeon]
MLKPINKLLIFVIVVWIILAVLFGFYDLNISIAVVDENSNWGIFGADYGEAPGYGLIGIAISTLIGSYNKNIKKQKIPAYVIIAIGFLLFILGFAFDEQDLILDGGIISICVTIFLIFTFNKEWQNYRKISAVIIILAVLNPLIFVQLIKLFWGRIRFRDLSPGFIDFTPWFIPQGITGNQSFPSGHTAMGWMFLPLLITLRKWQWKSIIRIVGTTLIIGWGLFVGLSRIVVGAHYSSDVLFSSIMATIITILLYKRLYVKTS